jgi:hypothetical protein
VDDLGAARLKARVISLAEVAGEGDRDVQADSTVVRGHWQIRAVP